MSNSSIIRVSTKIFSKYKSITKAVEDAKPGSKIIVEPGTYRENIIIDKNIEITGDGDADKIIIKSYLGTCIRVKSGLVHINRITIEEKSENPSKMGNQGILIEGGAVSIEDCFIGSINGTGIEIQNTKEVSIVKRSTICNSVIGIEVCNEGKVTFEDCKIYDNKEKNIMIHKKGNPHINYCDIYDSKDGIWVEEGGLGKIENCLIYNNELSNIAIVTEGNPRIVNCKVHNSEGIGIWISENGLGRFEKCEVSNSKFSNINIEKGGKPEFYNCKIHNGGDCSIWVNLAGFGRFNHCQVYNNHYSNIRIEAASNPQFTNCKIYESAQRGVWIDKNGLGRFENCEIYSNGWDNVLISQGSNPTLYKCKIYDGNQYGVFIKNHGFGIIDSCEIYNNKKGEISKEENGGPIIKSPIGINIDKPLNSEINEDNSPVEEISLNLQEILGELDSLIGMENIKEEIRKTIQYIEFNKELQKLGVESEDSNIKAEHTVLYGNPGTGKTTVAKIIGKLYKAMGLLSLGHIVQVNREKLVGKHIGHTAPKTKEWIDKAIGGVLFIDEAYELTNKGNGNDFGPEAIAVILEEMENRRGEFVVIVAGYNDEMEQFLEVNPGLRSRFTQYYHLQDYTPEEMVAIAEKIVTDKKRHITSEALDMLFEEFTALWRKRDRFFSNARTVRNYVEAMLKVLPDRVNKLPKSQWTKELLLTLTVDDVVAALPKEEKKTFQVPINEELLSKSLNALNRMIGMSRVKEEIEELVTLVRYYKEEGKDLEDLSPHTMLIGSPGTGKTEVARIIARIYEALGIMERGDLIEVNRDKLISPYTGETEKIAAKFIDEAMGGILFIDEAYQLTQYGSQDPGHKVVEVLLKHMEDDRGKFIVIVAGYKRNMEEFLQSNDGLRRRFLRKIEFEDYTPKELLEIAELMIKEKGYKLDALAREALQQYFILTYEKRDSSFGNAGFVRNVITEAIKNTDYRVAKIEKQYRTIEMTTTILVEDINLVDRVN